MSFPQADSFSTEKMQKPRNPLFTGRSHTAIRRSIPFFSVTAALFVLLFLGCGNEDVPDQKPEDTLVFNVGSLTIAKDPPLDLSDPAVIADLLAIKPLIHLKHIPTASVSLRLPISQRHFALGAVPIGAPGPNTTDEDLKAAIIETAKVAECYVIRQKIDWEAFRPGGNATPDFTDDILRLLDLARDAGFPQTLVELDPIVDRHNVGPLPPALAGAGFGHPDVRTALRRQAIVVVTQGRPDYLSIAVEANGYFESNPEDFENFVSLHKELYDEIKSISPETQVMASFNLEGIQGLLSGIGGFADHGPQWFLLDKFEPEVDAFAFSTLPFPVFFDPVQLPDDYLSRITLHTDRPIVLSEVGWTTYAGASGSEAAQAAYLSLMSRQALHVDQLRIFAWTILFDAELGSIFDAFPAFRSLGLLEADGKPKIAWNVWRQLHAMTYER